MIRRTAFPVLSHGIGRVSAGRSWRVSPIGKRRAPASIRPFPGRRRPAGDRRASAGDWRFGRRPFGSRRDAALIHVRTENESAVDPGVRPVDHRLPHGDLLALRVHPIHGTPVRRVRAQADQEIHWKRNFF